MTATDMARYMRERRARRRADLIALLGGVCVVCGTTEDLEFDHIKRNRLFVLSGCYLDKAWTAILAEAKKCQLLCHTHHREKTVANGETGGGQNKITGVTRHGLEVGYMTDGCRCLLCRTARYDARVARGELKGTRGMRVRSEGPTDGELGRSVKPVRKLT